MIQNTTTSQVVTQNSNMSNNITIGSTGTDYGQFAPVNETTPTFKNSNDVAASVGLLGGTAGPAGMSKAESDNAQRSSTYDGYTSSNKSGGGTQSIFIYIGIALAILASAFAIFKKKKSK